MNVSTENFMFDLNGGRVAASRGSQQPLVHFLRDVSGLKGTRFGCGEEQCGACVVMIDGEARASCQVEVGNLEGKRVMTVEAMLETQVGMRLAEAFDARQAGQCGFCLSGILMRAYALLVQSAGMPSRENIKAALQSHLCRCGAHTRIIAAILDAGQAQEEEV